MQTSANRPSARMNVQASERTGKHPAPIDAYAAVVFCTAWPVLRGLRCCMHASQWWLYLCPACVLDCPAVHYVYLLSSPTLCKTKRAVYRASSPSIWQGAAWYDASAIGSLCILPPRVAVAVGQLHERTCMLCASCPCLYLSTQVLPAITGQFLPGRWFSGRVTASQVESERRTSERASPSQSLHPLHQLLCCLRHVWTLQVHMIHLQPSTFDTSRLRVSADADRLDR
jgi:ferredoxin